MRKTTLKTLVPALLLLAVLAGCAPSSAAGPDKLVALQPSDWPQQPTAAPLPTPTPFPRMPAAEAKAALAGLPDAAAAADPPADAATADPPAQVAPRAQGLAAPAPAAGARPAAGTQGQVKVDALNLRAGPGTDYPVVGSLRSGDGFTALATDPGRNWLLVAAGGRQGWLSLAYVKLNGDPTALPAATPAAPPPTVAPAAATPPSPQAGTPAAQSHTNPTAGQLVFQLASGGDIMIVDADGTGLRRLTAGLDPALSHDGKTVAFTRWQGDQGSLWLIGTDGSHERQVADGLRKAKGAEWSPDDQRVVVNYQHEGRLQPIRECQPLGKSQPNIPGNAYDIAVNGSQICYTRPADEHWALRVVDVASGQGQDIYGGMYAFRPTWDPSQAWRIVDEAGNGLLETSVNNDHHQNITDQPEDQAPAFSPDGRFLAVAYRNVGGRFDIARLNADGSGRTRLTDMPMWAEVGPDQQDPWQNLSPAWSPDGTQIAFLTNRTGRWEIWVMAPDGSNQRPLFSQAVNDSLAFKVDYVDERILSWR